MSREYVAAVALFSAIAAAPFAFIAGAASPLHTVALLLTAALLAALGVAAHLRTTGGRRPGLVSGALIAVAVFAVTSFLYFGLSEQSLPRASRLASLALLFYGWLPAVFGAIGARLLVRVGLPR